MKKNYFFLISDICFGAYDDFDLASELGIYEMECTKQCLRNLRGR